MIVGNYATKPCRSRALQTAVRAEEEHVAQTRLGESALRFLLVDPRTRHSSAQVLGAVKNSGM